MSIRYFTDLTDEQWQVIKALLPTLDVRKGGRPRRWSHREILNALFYMEKTGCQWRMLPSDLPPKETVWQQYRRWRDDGTLEKIRLQLNRKVREKAGKSPLPSVMMADSQSVKTVLKGGNVGSMVARELRDVSGIF